MRFSTSFRPSRTELDATAPLLEVSHLTGPASNPIVHDVSFTVHARETVVILGPIQSGKSTLLRHIVGLEHPSSGTVTIEGHTVPDGGPEADRLIRRMRRRIGVVFENSALLRHISLQENVELPLLEHTEMRGHEARDMACELLTEVHVDADADAMPGEVGREVQRRVALARALVLRPAVLLLDEPTIGLDAHAAHEFDDTLEFLQARYGFGVVVLSREVRHAFGRPSRILVLAAGHVVADGSREEILASEHPVVRRLLHRRGREIAEAGR